MTLELLVWIAPFFSAVIFLFLECNKSKQPNYFLLRGRVILGIVVLTLIINYLNLSYLLIPLVNLPIQLMSLAALDMPRVLNFILCFLIIDFFNMCCTACTMRSPFYGAYIACITAIKTLMRSQHFCIIH